MKTTTSTRNSLRLGPHKRRLDDRSAPSKRLVHKWIPTSEGEILKNFVRSCMDLRDTNAQFATNGLTITNMMIELMRGPLRNASFERTDGSACDSIISYLQYCIGDIPSFLGRHSDFFEQLSNHTNESRWRLRLGYSQKERETLLEAMNLKLGPPPKALEVKPHTIRSDLSKLKKLAETEKTSLLWSFPKALRFKPNARGSIVLRNRISHRHGEIRQNCLPHYAVPTENVQHATNESKSERDMMKNDDLLTRVCALTCNCTPRTYTPNVVSNQRFTARVAMRYLNPRTVSPTREKKDERIQDLGQNRPPSGPLSSPLMKTPKEKDSTFERFMQRQKDFEEQKAKTLEERQKTNFTSPRRHISTRTEEESSPHKSAIRAHSNNASSSATQGVKMMTSISSYGQGSHQNTSRVSPPTYVFQPKSWPSPPNPSSLSPSSPSPLILGTGMGGGGGSSHSSASRLKISPKTSPISKAASSPSSPKSRPVIHAVQPTTTTPTALFPEQKNNVESLAPLGIYETEEKSDQHTEQQQQQQQEKNTERELNAYATPEEGDDAYDAPDGERRPTLFLGAEPVSFHTQWYPVEEEKQNIERRGVGDV